jgi:sulfotransferase family protein
VNRVVVVASHRRSGTHLMLDSLRSNVPDVERRFMTLERIEPSHEKHMPVAKFDRRLRSQRGVVLVKTHALPGAGAWQAREAADYASELLATAPTIYVHRDGRDVLVSLYRFVQSYSPQVAAQSFAEFLRSRHTGRDAIGVNRAVYWQEHVMAWLDSDPTTSGSYEGLRDDFEPTLRAIAERLELQLRPVLGQVLLEPRRRRIPVLDRLLRVLGPPGSTAIRPQAGRVGAWREVFDDADLAWFESEASEAMRRLGYSTGTRSG